MAEAVADREPVRRPTIPSTNSARHRRPRAKRAARAALASARLLLQTQSVATTSRRVCSQGERSQIERRDRADDRRRDHSVSAQEPAAARRRAVSGHRSGHPQSHPARPRDDDGLFNRSVGASIRGALQWRWTAWRTGKPVEIVLPKTLEYYASNSSSSTPSPASCCSTCLGTAWEIRMPTRSRPC